MADAVETAEGEGEAEEEADRTVWSGSMAREDFCDSSLQCNLMCLCAYFNKTWDNGTVSHLHARLNLAGNHTPAHQVVVRQPGHS